MIMGGCAQKCGVAVPEGLIGLRCVQCGLSYARLTNGCLVIQSVHHGRKHVNMIHVAELVRLCGFRMPAESLYVEAEDLAAAEGLVEAG